MAFPYPKSTSIASLLMWKYIPTLEGCISESNPSNHCVIIGLGDKCRGRVAEQLPMIGLGMIGNPDLAGSLDFDQFSGGLPRQVRLVIGRDNQSSFLINRENPSAPLGNATSYGNWCSRSVWEFVSWLKT